ncbi:MAG: cell division topological specificity factor MinE [Alphaproteobacteria bacterium]|jgi:cell division topological specificity factor|nr:cell division topological specificity factor MinE [Alphaproteobacteria bacterium]
MRLFEFFRSKSSGTKSSDGGGGGQSADKARERLQLVLAHERLDRWSADYVPVLQKEILAAIAKHIPIDQEKVAVKLERGADMSTLEVNIELPAPQEFTKKTGPRLAAGAT